MAGGMTGYRSIITTARSIGPRMPLGAERERNATAILNGSA